MEKRMFSILLTCLLVICVVEQPLAAEKKFLISFGTTASASGYYAYCVGVAKTINDAIPEVSITVLETGGVVDNVKRLRKGDINLFLSNSTADYSAFHGVGQFKDIPPQTDIRVLWYFIDFPMNWIVRKGSGINSLKDLNDKEFSPGGLGTSTEKITQEIFDFLNIKPKYHRGGMSDASEAFKDRRLVGVTKAGVAPDSYIVEIATFFPIELLGLDKDELKKVTEKFPYYSSVKIPSGVYKGVDKDVWTVTGLMGISCQKSMDETMVYKMTKAMWEGKGRKYWEAAYGPSAKFQVLERTLEGASIPLHSGAIKYFEEKGYKVPQHLRSQ